MSKSYSKDSPIWINEKQTSEITGDALSTLRNHRHNGTGIPYYKIGKSCRYKVQDVIAYMESHRIETEPK